MFLDRENGREATANSLGSPPLPSHEPKVRVFDLVTSPFAGCSPEDVFVQFTSSRAFGTDAVYRVFFWSVVTRSDLSRPGVLPETIRRTAAASTVLGY